MKKYLNSVEEVVKALKAGKEINIEDSIGKYVMDNGTICRLYDEGQILINADIHLNFGTKLYTEEPEPLKFEVNRAYKTSNGEKVFLYEKRKNNEYNLLYFIGDRLDFNTYDNGKFLKDGAINIHNIVGYWED